MVRGSEGPLSEIRSIFPFGLWFISMEGCITYAAASPSPHQKVSPTIPTPALDDVMMLPPIPPPVRHCASCSSTLGVKVCSRCLVVSYCGKSCQRADYQHHKPTCLAMVTLTSTIIDAAPEAIVHVPPYHIPTKTLSTTPATFAPTTSEPPEGATPTSQPETLPALPSSDAFTPSMASRIPTPSGCPFSDRDEKAACDHQAKVLQSAKSLMNLMFVFRVASLHEEGMTDLQVYEELWAPNTRLLKAEAILQLRLQFHFSPHSPIDVLVDYIVEKELLGLLAKFWDDHEPSAVSLRDRPTTTTTIEDQSLRKACDDLTLVMLDHRVVSLRQEGKTDKEIYAHLGGVGGIHLMREIVAKLTVGHSPRSRTTVLVECTVSAIFSQAIVKLPPGSPPSASTLPDSPQPKLHPESERLLRQPMRGNPMSDGKMGPRLLPHRRVQHEAKIAVQNAFASKLRSIRLQGRSDEEVITSLREISIPEVISPFLAQVPSFARASFTALAKAELQRLVMQFRDTQNTRSFSFLGQNRPPPKYSDEGSIQLAVEVLVVQTCKFKISNLLLQAKSMQKILQGLRDLSIDEITAPLLDGVPRTELLAEYITLLARAELCRFILHFQKTFKIVLPDSVTEAEEDDDVAENALMMMMSERGTTIEMNE